LSPQYFFNPEEGVVPDIFPLKINVCQWIQKNISSAFGGLDQLFILFSTNRATPKGVANIFF